MRHMTAGYTRQVAHWLVAATVLLMATAALAGPLPVTEIAPGVFLHEGKHEESTAENLGGIANLGFVVGGEAVAVIDSGGSAAQGRSLLEAIRQVTDLPVRYVINSHVHPDHLFGNAAFRESQAVFVGHAKLPRALAARGAHYLQSLHELIGERAQDTAVVEPDLTVSGQIEVDLGGRVLALTAFQTAHTDNDLTVFDRQTATLWTGDLLFSERVPVVDGSLKGWLDATAKLRSLDAALVVPGHGPASHDWPAALDAQERYLRVLLDETRAILAEGGTMEQAIETVGRSERDRWLLFDDYHPRNLVTAFSELEWE